MEEARLFTLPDEPPAVLVAASGPTSAKLAGRLGDGLVSVAPDPKLVDVFLSTGGRDSRPGEPDSAPLARTASALGSVGLHPQAVLHPFRPPEVPRNLSRATARLGIRDAAFEAEHPVPLVEEHPHCLGVERELLPQQAEKIIGGSLVRSRGGIVLALSLGHPEDAGCRSRATGATARRLHCPFGRASLSRRRGAPPAAGGIFVAVAFGFSVLILFFSVFSHRELREGSAVPAHEPV